MRLFPKLFSFSSLLFFSQPLQEVPEHPDLESLEAKKRDTALDALNKHHWVWSSSNGEKVYHGKRLAAAGNFAILREDRDGKGFTLAPVHEWFEFNRKASFKPLTIEEAERHLKDIQRKSVQDAAEMNRKLIADKMAAEAAALEDKRAEIGREIEAEERRELVGKAADDEQKEDNVDYEFEFSDDDDAAAVMVLATDADRGDEKEKDKGDPEDEGLENPLAPRVLSPEEKLEKWLKKFSQEIEEQERKEREEEEAKQKQQQEEEEGNQKKRDRDGEGGGGEGEDDGTLKKRKKQVVILPLTEEEVVSALKQDPNMTTPKLISLFKPSFGTDTEKKARFLKIVAKVAVTKTVAGMKVLRLKENKE